MDSCDPIQLVGALPVGRVCGPGALPEHKNEMRYTKSLDGIRGVSVLSVMLFHFGYLGCGWVGVQAFFVLSGYLITSILLMQKRESLASYLGTFYWHRALRILPVLCALLLVIAAIYLTSGKPESFRGDWPWLVGFAANFARLRTGDLGAPFVHLWSLAVEQQFYMLWPFLIFFLSAKAFRRLVIMILLLAPLARLATVGLMHSAEAAYVLPYAQFDAFAAGAAIPLWGMDRMRYALRWFGAALILTVAAGLAVLAYRYANYRDAFIGSLGYPLYLIPAYGYVWGYSLLDVVSTLAIACAIRGAFPFLESGWLVRVGKLSYGIYVYHLPLLCLFQYWGYGARMRPLVICIWAAVTLAVSWMSYRWMEAPLLRLKDFWARRAGSVASAY